MGKPKDGICPCDCTFFSLLFTLPIALKHKEAQPNYVLCSRANPLRLFTGEKRVHGVQQMAKHHIAQCITCMVSM